MRTAEHQRAGRRIGRRWLLAGGLLTVLVVLVFAVPTGRVAVQTLALLPAILPGLPVDPLAATTPAPDRAEYRYAYAVGDVEADVYRPRSAGRHGGVVLLLGARPLPKRDPQVVRLADALARLGLTVVVPESSNLMAGRVVPEERDAIRRSYDLLLAQPGVDPSRSGIVGFSVGASLAIAAASEPDLRDRVRVINSLGAYADAATLVVDAASQTTLLDGQPIPWEPSPLTREVLAIQLVEALSDPADQATLRRRFVDRVEVPADDLARLTPAGQAVRDLLAGTNRASAEQTLARVGQAVHDRLAAISPATSIDGLRADLFLMHDRGDSYLPFTHSRRLAEAAPPGTLQRYTELRSFEHVVPRPGAEQAVVLGDLWSLFDHLRALLSQLL